MTSFNTDYCMTSFSPAYFFKLVASEELDGLMQSKGINSGNIENLFVLDELKEAIEIVSETLNSHSMGTNNMNSLEAAEALLEKYPARFIEPLFKDMLYSSLPVCWSNIASVKRLIRLAIMDKKKPLFPEENNRSLSAFSRAFEKTIEKHKRVELSPV